MSTQDDINAPPRVPEAVIMVPVEAIHADPEIFQYRSGINAEGEVESHRTSGLRNGPIKPVVLYENENGRLSMVDGHHRLAGAKREGIAMLPAYVLSWKNGISPQDAMVLGAYINLDQEFGRGEQHSEQEVVDAARVFHKVHNGEAKEVAPPPLPVRQPGQLQDAYVAGMLADPAFGYVEQGDVAVNAAATVSRTFGTPTTQMVVMKLIRSLPKDTQQSI